MVKIVKVVENKIKYFSKIFWAAPFWRVGRERGNKLFIPPGPITSFNPVYLIIQSWIVDLWDLFISSLGRTPPSAYSGSRCLCSDHRFSTGRPCTYCTSRLIVSQASGLKCPSSVTGDNLANRANHLPEERFACQDELLSLTFLEPSPEVCWTLWT